MENRWRVGEGKEESQCMIFRDGQCVGMLQDPRLAMEIVTVLNDEAKNDREYIVKLLRRESNRIFNKQIKDFPTNVIDNIAYNLSVGNDDKLTEKP